MLCLSYFVTYFRFHFHQNVIHWRFSLSLFIYSFFFSGKSFCQLCWEWRSDFVYAFYTIIWLTQSARETWSFGKDLFLSRLTQSVSRELFLYFILLPTLSYSIFIFSGTPIHSNFKSDQILSIHFYIHYLVDSVSKRDLVFW